MFFDDARALGGPLRHAQCLVAVWGFLAFMPVAVADEGTKPTLMAIAGATSDYVYRGVSLRDERPSPILYVEATYGPLYANATLIGTTLGEDALGRGLGNIEADGTLGLTHSIAAVDFNIGVKYTGYPNGRDLVAGMLIEAERDFIEPFAGATWRIGETATLGAFAYWTPDYYYETGRVVTLEAQGGLALPDVGDVSSKLTGVIGGARSAQADVISPGKSYMYYNVGVEAHLEQFIFDLRYWNTDVANLDGYEGRVVLSVGIVLK